MNQSKVEAKKIKDLVLFFTISKRTIAMNDIAFLWIILAFAFFGVGFGFSATKLFPEQVDWYSIVFAYAFTLLCFWFYRYSLKNDA